MPEDSLSEEELSAKVEQLRAREGVPGGPVAAVDAGTVVDAEYVDPGDVPADYPLDVGGEPLRLEVLVSAETTVPTYPENPAALLAALGLAPGDDRAATRAALAGREVVVDYRDGHYVVDVAATGATREEAFGRAFRAIPVLGALVVVGAALVGVAPVTGLGWALLALGWVGLPIAIVADARSLPTWGDWNPSTAWVVAAVLYPINVGVATAYAVRRWVLTTPPTEEAPRNLWALLVAAGVVLWGGAALFGAVGAPGALYVLTMGTAWVVVPLAIHFDAVEVAGRTDWDPLDLLWVLLASFWAFGAVVGATYLLWRRWRLR